MATTPRHRPITAPRVRRSIATVLFLLALLPPATSQAPPQRFPDAPITRTNYTFSTAAFVIILIAAFGIVGIFTAFLYQWLLAAERQAAASVADATTDSASWRQLGGLNPEMVATFPTMTYAEAKVLNARMGALECAVCICEFEDEEALRLLPGCCHVFHPDCIDAWLASHVTCPVCRSDLAIAAEDQNWLPDSSATAPAPFEADDSPPIRLPDSSPTAPAPSEADDLPQARLPDSSVTAPAPSEADDPPQDHVIVVDAASSEEAAAAAAEAVELSLSESGQQAAAEPPPSSLSAEHTLPRPRSLEDVDRFTLRLPDHVRRRIFSDRRVQRCASCAAVFPVTTTGSQERLTSGSGSGGSRVWVWNMRLAWSEQWQPFILRTISSTFTPWKKGDGSDSSSTKKGEGGESSPKKREAEDSSKQRFSALRNSFDWIFGGGASAGNGCRRSTADRAERGQPQ